MYQGPSINAYRAQIKFQIHKWAIFCKVKETKELHGGVQVMRRTGNSTDSSASGVVYPPFGRIDAEISEKGHLWMETNLKSSWKGNHQNLFYNLD